MPDALRNARYERALIRRDVDPVVVDGPYGITCTLVPRCEGIIARFTVRDTHTVPSTLVGSRDEKYGMATHHVQNTYDVGPLTATTALREAEEAAWQRLYEQGIDVPDEFRGD